MTLEEDGLTYEADPRHADLLMSSLGLTAANHAASPGVKPSDRDDHAQKHDEPDVVQLDYENPDAVIASICSSDISAGSASIDKHQAEKQRMNANTGTTKGRPINKMH